MSSVLLTGASGVIGSELVPHLLAANDWKLHLVLRAKSSTHLHNRLEELYAYWQADVPEDILRSRVRAVPGDVCRPWLGMEAPTYRRLAAEVTHIIHCAGKVKLNQTLEEARANAVAPAENIAEFARDCQRHGQLKKVDVVSTIGVAGKMPGLISESPLTGARRFHNSYEAAKAEAETFFLRQLGNGLPLTIHRPSMVVGHSRTGRVRQFQVFYYLCDFLCGTRTRGIVVDTGSATLDIIPVDFVAAAICASTQRPDATGRIFHLCSGPQQAVPLRHLSARLRMQAGRRGHRVFRPKVLPRVWFQRLLAGASQVTWGKPRRSLHALSYFLAYLETTQAFQVAETAAYFAPLGISAPNVNGCLDLIVGTYFDRASGRSGSKNQNLTPAHPGRMPSRD